MSIEELKAELHEMVEQADERLLRMIFAAMVAYEMPLEEEFTAETMRKAIEITTQKLSDK